MQTLLLLCLAATTAIAGFHGTFNGASCYSAPSSVSIDSITSELTFELWVHPLSGGASLQGLGGTWDDVTGAKRTWFMWLESLKPAVYSTNTPTIFPKIIAPSAIPLNQWTHIAFTKVAGSGTSTLYINGVSVATGVFPAAIYVNDEPLRVGCAYAGGASVKYLNGYLDGVRVWNVARNSAEVQAGMNSCGTPSGSGLVAQYNFDEGSGTTLGDTSGNGNNAPLSHGAPGWGAGDSQVCPTPEPTPAPTPSPVYCFLADFSTTQNPFGVWSLGLRSGSITNPGPFALLDTPQNGGWKNGGTYPDVTPASGTMTFHPSDSLEAVIRYTATTNQLAVITVTTSDYYPSKPGASHNVVLRHGDTAVSGPHNSKNAVNINTQVAMLAGETIELALNSLGDNGYDRVIPTFCVTADPHPATPDPAVAAFCDDIASKCTALDAECTTIRNGGHTAVADDCDASVAACNDMHQDCLDKVGSCPAV